MHVRDGTERKVSFNAKEKLGDKIDKLTVVMSKLAAKDSNEKRPFKPQYIKAEVLTHRGRKGPIVKEVIRIEVVGQITEPEDNIEVIDLDKIIQTTIFEGTLEDTEDKIVEANMGIIGTMIRIEAGIG